MLWRSSFTALCRIAEFASAESSANLVDRLLVE